LFDINKDIPLLTEQAKHTSKQFILGKNLNNMANRVAKVRFTESKSSTKYHNPWFLWDLEFTKSGRKCQSHCAIDPNGDGDKCWVYVGSKWMQEDCVAIANLNRLKHVIAQRDIDDAIKVYPPLIGEINELLKQFKGATHAHYEMVNKRND